MSTALINVLMVFFAMLLIVVIVLVTRVIILKREIKSIGNQLKETREKSYNKQVQIALIDNDLSEMTLQVNKNLDYQKQLKLNQEKIEKQMKQSISDIAHDLRTPLTVIKGNLQMICKDQGISDQNLEYIKICEEKADTLKEMVDGFFELSVLESDQNEVPIHKVNATNILMQFVIDHEALIREKNLVPEISFPEKTINILGDEAFINRMLSNLLNNILKSDDDYSHIKVAFEPTVQYDEKTLLKKLTNIKNFFYRKGINISLLYGGKVLSTNIKKYNFPILDGFLIGQGALDIDEVKKMINESNESIYRPKTLAGLTIKKFLLG